ncbi:MAG: hypothetical protein ACTSQE_13330, partial [Candidatus Heimdallarchaeaceae archaeon]
NIHEKNTKRISRAKRTFLATLGGFSLIIFVLYNISYWKFNVKIAWYVIFLLFVLPMLLAVFVDYLGTVRSKETLKLLRNIKEKISGNPVRVSRKIRMVLTIILIVILLGFPLRVISEYTLIKDFNTFNFNPSDNFGYNWNINRTVEVDDFYLATNGSIAFDVIINYSFHNIPENLQFIYLQINSIVIDTDYDGYFDSFYNLYNISTSSQSTNVSINLDEANVSVITISSASIFSFIGSIDENFLSGSHFTCLLTFIDALEEDVIVISESFEVDVF